MGCNDHLAIDPFACVCLFYLARLLRLVNLLRCERHRHEDGIVCYLVVASEHEDVRADEREDVMDAVVAVNGAYLRVDCSYVDYSCADRPSAYGQCSCVDHSCVDRLHVDRSSDDYDMHQRFHHYDYIQILLQPSLASGLLSDNDTVREVVVLAVVNLHPFPYPFPYPFQYHYYVLPAFQGVQPLTT